MFLKSLWVSQKRRCRFCGEETWLYATGAKAGRIATCQGCWNVLEALGMVRPEPIPEGMEARDGGRP